jgi:hypothetical protein
MQLRFSPILAALALGACSAPAPQPGVSTAPLGGVTTMAVDAAEDAVVARLQALGFTVVESRESGVIQGEIRSGAPTNWAACDRVEVTELGDRTRSQWAEAEDLRARVTVRFTELAGQTSVALTPRFDGVYLNRLDNLPFDRACSSMGVLERDILAAIGPVPATS